MNRLPNEVILRILSHVDSLSDSIAISRVNSRFNILVKDRTWRRRLVVTRKEIEKTLPKELNEEDFNKNMLMQEVLESKNLTTVTIQRCKVDSPFNKQLPAFINECLKKRPYLEFLEYLVKCETVELFCRKGAFILSMLRFREADQQQSDTLQHINDIVRNSKFDLKTFIIYENDSIEPALKILSRYKHSLEVVVLDELTDSMRVFRELEKVSNLKQVSVLPEAKGLRIRDPIPIISIESVNILLSPWYLEQINRREILGIFLSEKLKKIYISGIMIYRLQEIIFQRCPNLESIKIAMTYCQTISKNDLLLDFEDILMEFKGHLNVKKITIDCCTKYFLKKLKKRASVILDGTCVCKFSDTCFEAVKK